MTIDTYRYSIYDMTTLGLVIMDIYDSPHTKIILKRNHDLSKALLAASRTANHVLTTV